MNKHLNWDIQPGEGVGPIKLGMTIDEVKAHISFKYVITQNEYSLNLELETGSISLSFKNESKRLWWIYLNNDFKGKILNTISLGSTFTEVKAKFKEIRSYGYIDDYNELYPPTTIPNVLIYDSQEDEYVMPGATFYFNNVNKKKELSVLKSISIYRESDLIGP